MIILHFKYIRKKNGTLGIKWIRLFFTTSSKNYLNHQLLSLSVEVSEVYINSKYCIIPIKVNNC